jgi:hypothetical protein
MTNLELAGALRHLADIYEKNSDLPQLYEVRNANMCIFCSSPEEWYQAIQVFGAGSKDDSAEWLVYTPNRLPFVKIHGYKRNICERVVVGTKTVPAFCVPEQLFPARVEEIVEYRCRPFTEPPEGVLA